MRCGEYSPSKNLWVWSMGASAGQWRWDLPQADGRVLAALLIAPSAK